MPHNIIRKVWDYCSYSKMFFALILLLLFISSFIQNYIQNTFNLEVFLLFEGIGLILISGYGMLITRSRINHGKRLPKIVVKDIIFLGIKSVVVIFVFYLTQTVILNILSAPLNFPIFNLEELLLDFFNTLDMFYSHNPVHTFIFIVFGSVLFYVTTFFMEIALAKLADTNSLLEAFNLKAIKRSIDVVGWKNYAKEYTVIILVIVMLSFLASVHFPFRFMDSITDTFFHFLVFVTQYLGIGAIYSKIKDLETK